MDTVGATVDVSSLSPASQRAVKRFAQWLRLVTLNTKEHGKFEAIAGEGRVKVIHIGDTLTPDKF